MKTAIASMAIASMAIEPMAIWCSNCKAQQDNVKEAYDRIETAGVTYISLGIDPAENPDALATYADRRGYRLAIIAGPEEIAAGHPRRAGNDRFEISLRSAPSSGRSR